MARPTVTHQLELPGGVKPTSVQNHLRLVASLDGATPGYSDGTAVLAVSRPTIDRDGLVTMANMRPTSGSTVGDVIDRPAGCVYQLTSSWPGGGITETFTVPDEAGPVRLADHLAIPPTDLVVIVAAENIVGLTDIVDDATALAAATKVDKAGDDVTGDLVFSEDADLDGFGGLHPLLEAADTKVRQILAYLAKRRARDETPYRKGDKRGNANAMLGTGSGGHNIMVGDSHLVLGALDKATAQVQRQVNVLEDPGFISAQLSGFGGFNGGTGGTQFTGTTTVGPGVTGVQTALTDGQVMQHTGAYFYQLWVVYWAVPAGGATLEVGMALPGVDPAASTYDSWTTTDAGLAAPELRIRSINTLGAIGWDFEIRNPGAGTALVDGAFMFGDTYQAGAHFHKLAHAGYDSGPAEWGATDYVDYIAAVDALSGVASVTFMLGTNDYTGTSGGVDDYEADIAARVAEVRAAAPLATINLIGPHQHRGATLWPEMIEALSRVAITYGANFVDNYEALGPYTDPDEGANAYGFIGDGTPTTVDGVHLSTVGNDATNQHALERLWGYVRDTVAAVRIDGSRALTGSLQGKVRGRPLWRVYMDAFSIARLELYPPGTNGVTTHAVVSLANQNGLSPALMFGDGTATPAHGIAYLLGTLYMTAPMDLTTAGATGTASAHAAHRGYVEAAAGRLKPSAATWENFSRKDATIANLATLTSGTVFAVRAWFPKGAVVSSLAWTSGTTALAAGTNQWAGIADGTTRVVRAISADGTSGAWAANTEKTFTMAAAYTIPSDGEYYLFLNVTAGTVPTLLGKVNSNTTVNAKPPILCGTSSAGQTTPVAVGATLGAITVSANTPYVTTA